MEFIYSHYEYCNSTTSVDTSSTTVIREEQGVCQDFAHAALAFCRCLGIPARYVSGYFYDHTKDQSMRGSEASHAWIEVLVNGRGWFGLDPTNNRVVDETYIDYADADSMAKELERFENLVVLRTLSKSHAAAGLRCGVLFRLSRSCCISNAELPALALLAD